MGDTTQQQPAMAAPGGTPPAQHGMTPEQMQLIAQLMPSVAQPAMMQAMALRAKQTPVDPTMAPPQ